MAFNAFIASEEANDGIYPWTVPDEPTANALVKITAYDSCMYCAADTSDVGFTIMSADAPPAVTVLAPNGGETWYGCDTEDLEPGWSYQRVHHNEGTDSCEIVSLSWNLPAGNHSLDLRNREGSDFQGAAAVARVLVTSDSEYVPTPEND